VVEEQWVVKGPSAVGVDVHFGVQMAPMGVGSSGDAEDAEDDSLAGEVPETAEDEEDDESLSVAKTAAAKRPGERRVRSLIMWSIYRQPDLSEPESNQ
jgi:hypothetical protein